MATERTTLAYVVSPNVSDSELALTILHESGIEARAHATVYGLAAAIDERSGCAILVEEALVASELAALREALARLPAWCDLPLILVGRDVGALAIVAADTFPQSGNVTLLERPLNPHTLVSAVRVGLRAAARQQQMGELLAQREAAVKQRDEFLAVLAHELRNPLAPMRNALHMLRLLPAGDPRAESGRAILERQIDHMVRMVDDLMDVARLERGKVVLQKQRIDLNQTVAAAVETCKRSIGERGHWVRLNLHPQPLHVDADPVRIDQIVSNLLVNAAKFTPRPDEIRVETSVDGAYALLAVQDRGVGFDANVAEALFDPFLQMNPTLDRSNGGLGMGLTIARRIATLHRGSIQASSAGPGHGARFEVRLPLAPQPKPVAPAPAQPPADRRRQRIVVIEDNSDIRESTRSLLSMWGHEVLTAGDGRSGLELVRTMRPDIALVDVGLPGMSGYDVARAVRTEGPDVDVRLIAITAMASRPTDSARSRQVSTFIC